MEREIQKLFAILDSTTLEILPCFTDQARDITDINFRIGLNEGPQIAFRRENPELYYLTIRDKNGRFYQHGITVGSDQFMKCQNIANHIHQLNRNADYTNNVNANLSMLLGNLVTIVNPILDRVPPKNWS